MSPEHMHVRRRIGASERRGYERPSLIGMYSQRDERGDVFGGELMRINERGDWSQVPLFTNADNLEHFGGTCFMLQKYGGLAPRQTDGEGPKNVRSGAWTVSVSRPAVERGRSGDCSANCGQEGA